MKKATKHVDLHTAQKTKRWDGDPNNELIDQLNNRALAKLYITDRDLFYQYTIMQSPLKGKNKRTSTVCASWVCIPVPENQPGLLRLQRGVWHPDHFP